ncbi:hypothetical protein ABPG74_010078 [Tetrahymena malaccensis]
MILYLGLKNQIFIVYLLAIIGINEAEIRFAFALSVDGRDFIVTQKRKEFLKKHSVSYKSIEKQLHIFAFFKENLKKQKVTQKSATFISTCIQSSLSEQQLVDFTTTHGNQGFDGGDIDQKCQGTQYFSINDLQFFSMYNPMITQQLLSSNSFQLLQLVLIIGNEFGIFRDCFDDLNHYVLLIGYNSKICQ